MPVELNVQDEFWFRVKIKDGKNVYGLNCEIVYPAGLLAAVLKADGTVQTQLGSFLGMSTGVTLLANLQDDQQGKIVVAFSKKGSAAVSEGNGPLFDVRFRCIGVGEAEIGFGNSQIFNQSAQAQSSIFQPVSLKITATNFVTGEIVPVPPGGTRGDFRRGPLEEA